MKKLILSFAFLSALSHVASAQDVDFVTADADGSGGVSMEEVMAVMPDASDDAFVAADANGDGELDEAEYAVLISE